MNAYSINHNIINDMIPATYPHLPLPHYCIAPYIWRLGCCAPAATGGGGLSAKADKMFGPDALGSTPRINI